MPFLMVPITSPNSIDKRVIFFGGGFDFFAIFNYIFLKIGLHLGSFLLHQNDLLWFRILQQYLLFKMIPVSRFCSFANGHN